MKKTILTLGFFFAGQVFATSPYRGPYVAKIEGDNSCTITPFMVRIQKGAKVQTSNLNLSLDEMSRAIDGANREPVKSALHIRARKPELLIEAGHSMKKVVLYRDASRLQYRVGPNTSDLTNLIKAYCK